MSAYAFGEVNSPPDPDFNSEGGVNGSTTESSRAANAAAEETERSIEDTVSPIDGSGYTDHAYG